MLCMYVYIYIYIYYICKSPVVEPTAVVSAVPKPKVVEITQPGKCPMIISFSVATDEMDARLGKMPPKLKNAQTQGQEALEG